MIEFHGWLSIAMSTTGEDEDAIVEYCEQLNHDLVSTFIQNESFLLNNVNGYYILHFFGSHNRDIGTKNRIINFCKSVFGKAKGTHGIIYYIDDEDDKFHNEYQVFIIKKGALYKEFDKFLSPFNPEVED